MGLRGATSWTKGDSPSGATSWTKGDSPSGVSPKKRRSRSDLLFFDCESEVKWKWKWKKWIHFWSFKSAENFWGGSVHVGGHRYTGILCASKVLWVYEGRLAERRANHPAGRLSERRAIPPAALAQRRERPPLLWLWSEVKVKKKWSVFDPLNRLKISEAEVFT